MQVNFKEYSAEDILKQSKDKFESDYLYSYFRVGCEQDVKKDSLLLEPYLKYYEEYKCNKVESKPRHHKKKCGCKEECITGKCKSNVSKW